MPRTRRGPLSERARQVQALPDGFIACRAFRHAWEGRMAWGAEHKGRRYKGWATEVRDCIRCGASVTTIWDGQLQLQDRTMTYPKGYLVTGQREEHPGVEARRELLRRGNGSTA